MEREHVPSARAGIRLTEALAKIDGVADVRGAGLLIAAELAPGLDAKAVAQRCLDAGSCSTPSPRARCGSRRRCS